MNHTLETWPRPWRLAVIALGVLILCSCQAAPPPPCDMGGVHSDGYATLPPEAFTGTPAAAPAPVPAGPPGMEQGVPVPYTPTGPWTPPGIAGPWPRDEYLRDGGHAGPPITAGKRGEVRGLQMEDTVVEFQTADGQTRVQPTNPVFLYSPRFGAVRQVVNLDDQVQFERLVSIHEPIKPAAPRSNNWSAPGRKTSRSATTSAARLAVIFQSDQNFNTVSAAVGPNRSRTASSPTRTST